MLLNLTILIFCLLVGTPLGEITFTNNITRGTSCKTKIVNDAMQLDCEGMGFITSNKLPDPPGNFTMFVTILSAAPTVAVGLSTVLVDKCIPSLLPEAGTTWLNCMNCNKGVCYTDLAGYTASGPSQDMANLKVGKQYNWNYRMAGGCWEIHVTMDPANDDGSFPEVVVSPGNNCVSKWYGNTNDTTYAPYFELEGAGTASFLIKTDFCTVIPNCMICSDQTICHTCKANFTGSGTPLCSMRSAAQTVQTAQAVTVIVQEWTGWRLGLAIGLPLAFVFVLTLVGIGCYIHHQRKHQKYQQKGNPIPLHSPSEHTNNQI